MIDIARNFTTADNLKKLVDIFASYKMNVLHFHFADDEAWRLEIPGLEELTAVAAVADIPLTRADASIPVTMAAMTRMPQR